MPTYSYACTECNNRFDVVQDFTDDALTTCEKCNGRLRKIFGKVGVVFKGSGFYRNDSREAGKSTGSSSTAASSGSSGTSDTSAKSAKSSESGGSSSSASTSSPSGGTTSSDSSKAAPSSAPAG